ncbi:MAG: hypothetical protein ACPG1C_08420 [Alphaproteobacteria bacterium]
MQKLERYIAIYTLIITAPYFILETYHYVEYGSYLPMVLVDYIAMTLFVTSGYVALSPKYGSAAGLLCGAWGFAFCLNWRAFFWRAAELQQRTREVAEPIEQVASVLGVTLITSGIVFALTLYLAWPRKES